MTIRHQELARLRTDGHANGFPDFDGNRVLAEVALERGDHAVRKATSLERSRVERRGPGDAAVAFSVQYFGAADHRLEDRRLIADLSAVADAEASPFRLLQCGDKRGCAAMHVCMGVNAFKRRLSRLGASRRDAKRG